MRFLKILAVLLALCTEASAQSTFVTPAGPANATIVTGGVAVTVFPASTIARWATVENPPTATETLYVDFTANVATAGSSTAFALSPGQGFTIPGPLSTPVTAVAATSSHTFVAVRY